MAAVLPAQPEPIMTTLRMRKNQGSTGRAIWSLRNPLQRFTRACNLSRALGLGVVSQAEIEPRRDIHRLTVLFARPETPATDNLYRHLVQLGIYGWNHLDIARKAVFADDQAEMKKREAQDAFLRLQLRVF